MLKICLKSVPHSGQRYATCGDWVLKRKTAKILVSELGDEYQEFCIAIHEVIEMYLCKKYGITQKMVDDFDMAYERVRQPGDESEPGDQQDAPYFKQHQFAMQVELMLIREFGIDFQEYDRKIQNL